ncbi:hypothetical protein [Pseudolysinimonas kribbensis]|uniref:hypothetical protein n=1 Tax=Pseudolysinimonas kribbensis TaxID=433641 RepID=UPI0024E06967|nr:hypothetical protein [Pseudolysinimonas kribbensis]
MAQHLILKPVVWSLVTVQIIGREKVRKTSGAFVVVANHSSHLDAPSSSARSRGGCRATSRRAPPPTTSSTSGGVAG